MCSRSMRREFTNMGYNSGVGVLIFLCNIIESMEEVDLFSVTTQIIFSDIETHGSWPQGFKSKKLLMEPLKTKLTLTVD
ncbi:hypothetical protein TorRG33x02_293740 [Trema orientale]|uniref:Uncharacterized protein n=1 Tax=Trema orientale TaxID=63057 RepID=A0A2P5C8Z5_TREOI|nr:hypothetical protein TorRG33x02_293740 [Trema orientale]